MNVNLNYTISNVSHGNQSFGHGSKEQVVENRKKFLDKHSIKPKDCVAIITPDNGEIMIVDKNYKGQGMLDKESSLPVDALITQEKDLILFLTTADCLPIIFRDEKNKVIALVHASRKTTGMKISQRVVSEFKELGSNPKDIIIYIGPGIHKNSYKIKTPIQKQELEWQEFLEDLPNGETSIDIVGYNKKQLLDNEVLEKNIYISKIDTAISKDYFSHYRSVRNKEKEGRFVTVTWI